MKRVLSSSTPRWVVLVLLAASVVGLCGHVSTEVTDADATAIRTIVGPLPARNGTFERDLYIIRSVQYAVLSAAPHGDGIPFGRTREPADLLVAGTGMCYDRSRAIEKALRLSGFEARHVFLWRRGHGSHAASDVLTVDGWVRVDSNEAWVSVDGPPPNPIHGGIAIIGLYSQHGQFYPPFAPIPDVSWRELVGNVVGLVRQPHEPEVKDEHHQARRVWQR